MRYHWLREKIAKKHLSVYWAKGSENLADYFTKHHSPSHHAQMRKRYYCTNTYQYFPRNYNLPLKSHGFPYSTSYARVCQYPTNLGYNPTYNVQVNTPMCDTRHQNSTNTNSSQVAQYYS